MLGAASRVVRLKGGDPFVFGRGGEEMLACLAAGVPVRIVPGVSSALSVPARCGIPVTHRGVSRAFTVISGHTPPETHELEALVRLGGTIVILMGIANLAQTMAGLSRRGCPSAPRRRWSSAASPTPAEHDDHRRRAGRRGRRLDIGSPAVVVIGDVVAVAPAFAPTAGWWSLRTVAVGSRARAP